MNFETFHFIRPAWLLAALALLPLLWWVRRERREAGAWQRVCDAPLLAALLVESERPASRWGIPLFSLGWLVSVTAMAGPSWERLPQPSFESPTQTVLVLDLAHSMRTRDVEPSRVARARFELADLLERVEGAVALVLYAEESYAVTPLTDDPEVVAALLPVLEPGLMPGRGERLDRGLEEARLLLERAGARDGRIVVLADDLGDHPDAALETARRVAADGFVVAALGIAGESAGLADLARLGGGHFAPLAPDDSDVEALLAGEVPTFGDLGALSPSQVQADVWEDMGAWLLWLPLLLAPLAFRRGWATALAAPLCMGILAPANSAQAVDWEPWLLRGDQRAAQAFEAGEHARAVELFEDAAWRAAAQYRGGDYAAAAATLRGLEGSDARYNLGNALAQSGDLEGALAAYDEALAETPSHADAQHNRDLVEKLLEEQAQQQPPPSQPGEGPDSEGSDDPQNSDGSEHPQDADGSQGQSASDASDESGDSDASQDSEPSESTSASDATGQGESEGSEAEGGAETGESQSADSGSDGSSAQASPAGDEEETQTAARPRSQAGEASEPDAESREAEGAGLSARTGEEAPDARGEPGRAEPTDRQGDSTPAPSPRVLSESDQEVEQWLNRVPDDPGGLLREKLRRRYTERRLGAARGEW